MKDDITRVVFRYVLLLVLMYGFYVIAHGHLSPGGGFAGGVVLGLGAVSYTHLVAGGVLIQRKYCDHQ